MIFKRSVEKRKKHTIRNFIPKQRLVYECSSFLVITNKKTILFLKKSNLFFHVSFCFFKNIFLVKYNKFTLSNFYKMKLPIEFIVSYDKFIAD